MGKKRWQDRKTQIANFADERTTLNELKEDTFLLDAGHKILKCSACGNDLVDVWIVKENLPIKSFMRAECAYCGDHSFEIEVHGQFLTGHVSGLTMTDSVMEDFREENGTIIQKVLIKTVRDK